MGHSIRNEDKRLYQQNVLDVKSRGLADALLKREYVNQGQHQGFSLRNWKDGKTIHRDRKEQNGWRYCFRMGRSSIWGRIKSSVSNMFIFRCISDI